MVVKFVGMIVNSVIVDKAMWVKVVRMIVADGGVINGVFFSKEIFIDGIGASTDGIVAVNGLINNTVVNVTVVVINNSTVDSEDIVDSVFEWVLCIVINGSEEEASDESGIYKVQDKLSQLEEALVHSYEWLTPESLIIDIARKLYNTTSGIWTPHTQKGLSLDIQL
ncbi:hypothetical protein NDU88_008816 [Pleurodeles waltl]|uniref:Uncharacterized protein n=1 Tax=Pleurodeles waltl TaxID=8319 RepID=A0AAV7QSV8_PLEWA|nr:hypothetical protein NDU88_008816 [Pleurodeles waltl]